MACFSGVKFYIRYGVFFTRSRHVDKSATDFKHSYLDEFSSQILRWLSKSKLVFLLFLLNSFACLEVIMNQTGVLFLGHPVDFRLNNYANPN